jgi:nucleoid DNA-binding protein
VETKELEMIKNDIALAIEKKSEFNRAKSLLIVENVLDSIKDALAKKEKVEIRGFGSFKVVDKKTGYGRDIRRKKQIKITRGKRIKFRSGQELKSLISSK